ncbi:MAG: phytanoyl-CoA dioxygenase family protein, partial [Actinomycetota bacterium]
AQCEGLRMTHITDLALHPWNRDFRWSPSAPPRHLDDSQVRQFDEKGYVVVPGVFDSAIIAAIVEEIDGFEAEVEGFLKQLDGERISIAEAGAITFTTHLVARSERLRAFSLHPFFAGACADLIGPDVNLYWDQAVYKKPEKPRRFPWHQDNGYAFVEPQQYLTCWVALTDATLQNGCPQVATGLHRSGTLAHTYVEPLGWECLTEPQDVAVAEVAAGGVVVFSSLTPHLTGPNLTDAVRKAYILQYAPDGAAVLVGDPATGQPERRDPASDPARQFPVLRRGEPVTP